MAEPLSIVASFIVVIGAAEGVAKTLRETRNLTTAPDDNLAPANEASDFPIVSQSIESYAMSSQLSLGSSEHLEYLVVLMQRAEESLSLLHQIVQNISSRAMAQKARLGCRVFSE